MTASNENSLPSVSELRRERERAALTERILAAAREMFVQEGYKAVTLRKIATAIEYSPAAIYQYFEDKQDLVMAIIRADYMDLRNTLFECLDIRDPVDRLVEVGRRYVHWGITHPNHYRLLVDPPPAWVPSREAQWREDNPPPEQDILHLLSALVAQAIAAGRVKPEYTDAALVAAVLWAGIHGSVLLQLTMHDRGPAMKEIAATSFSDRFETLIRAFSTGLLIEDSSAT